MFFGSARSTTPTEARTRLSNAKKKLLRASRSNNPGSRDVAKAQKELEAAEAGITMAKYYQDAVKLSEMLTRWSKSLSRNGEQQFVICSGGGPGMMLAANKGAIRAGGLTMGLNISLPHEQFPNRYITPGLDLEFHYFFMRKFWFAYLAKALVVFPGGFGTMDELMEVLTLLQTGKIKKKLTVIIYGSKYWKSVVNFDGLVKSGAIDERDLRLFKFADDPITAFEILTGELKKNYGL